MVVQEGIAKGWIKTTGSRLMNNNKAQSLLSSIAVQCEACNINKYKRYGTIAMNRWYSRTHKLVT